MTWDDSKSNAGPSGEDESLSATGMFLRSFGAQPEQPPAPVEDQLRRSSANPALESQRVTEQIPARPMNSPSMIPVPAQSAPPEPKPAGPGEFTRMFQAKQEQVAPPAQSPAQSAPPAPISDYQAPAIPEPRQTPPPAPGEFTRIFVTPSAPPPEKPTRVLPEAPSYTPPVSGPSRMKGFSSPGISDSASAEATFTQIFRSSAPAATPAPESTSGSTPPPIQPAPTAPEVRDWQQTPAFTPAPRAVEPAPSTSSVTGILSSLGQPDPSGAPQRPEYTPRPVESFPAYTPAPPPPPSETQAGSVTRLIQRLSETPRQETPIPNLTSSPAPPVEPIPSAPSSSGPGAFTRMISGEAIKAAIEGSAAPASPAAAAAPAPAAPQIPMPKIEPPKFQAPKIEPPKAEGPKIAAPKIEAPKLAAPAVAAPKTKLEELVPILLIVNTFLLILILVVVIFAMRAK